MQAYDIVQGRFGESQKKVERWAEAAPDNKKSHSEVSHGGSEPLQELSKGGDQGNIISSIF